jgi:AraC-like protein
MPVPKSPRGLLALGTVLLVGAVGVGVASAMVMSTVLADTNVVRERIVRTNFTPSPDQPRFDSGWHIHPGVVIVQVQEGQLQITQGCRTHNLGPGDTYIEVPFLPVDATAKRAVTWTSTLILADSTPGTPDRTPASEPPCPTGNDQADGSGD